MTNRTLVPKPLPRPLRFRKLEPVRVPIPSARNKRLANGVYKGVAGVVEICVSALARAARLDGDIM